MPSVREWNQMLDVARRQQLRIGPSRRGRGVNVGHPWKVEGSRWDNEQLRHWRIDVAPAAVNDAPFCVPYRLDDARPRLEKLIPAHDGDQVVDVKCYDPDPPYLLVKSPPYDTGERTIFTKVADAIRPPFFAQGDYRDFDLYKSCVQMTASTNRTLIPFFATVSPPAFTNFRVFVGPPVTPAVARAGGFLTIANLYLVRPKNALDAKVGRGGSTGDADEMFVDQRVFYSVGMVINPPRGEFSLAIPEALILGLGSVLALAGGVALPIVLGADILAAGALAGVNAFLDAAFQSGEQVVTWTQ
jgi:hypothetical protein